MEAIGDSATPKAWNRGQAAGFVWVSSSPAPAEVAELEDRFPEVIRIPVSTLEETCACWKEKAVLVHTFQRWIPPDAFIREFRRAGVSGDIQALSLAHRCHILRFDELGSKEMVIGRPWVVNGQPVAIEEWRPEFVPAPDAVSSALLWVRLPSLPVEFWNEEILSVIMKPAGEFMYADSATRLISRGGFARVCMRVDLRCPLRPGVHIQGWGSPFWQQFQFEHLEGICPFCGSIHLSGPCSLSPSSSEPQKSSVGPCFGPWMSATRRRRPSGQVQRDSPKSPGSSQAAPEPPSSVALKPDQVAGGWISPAKVARRRPLKAGRSTASVVTASALAPASLESGPGLSKEGINVDRSVPADGVCAGSNSTVESAQCEVQMADSELQITVIPKVMSTNPFALLGGDNWKGMLSARSDANPGPFKRARPVEFHPLRQSSKNENRKGKGIASREKGAKVKSKLPSTLNPTRAPSDGASRSNEKASGQVPGCTGDGGQSSKEVNRKHDAVLSCLKAAIQVQSKDSGLPAVGARVAGAVSDAAVYRADIPRMDCTKQLDVGGTLSSGYLTDSVMLEDQGGHHPPPPIINENSDMEC